MTREWIDMDRRCLKFEASIRDLEQAIEWITASQGRVISVSKKHLGVIVLSRSLDRIRYRYAVYRKKEGL